MRIRDPGWRQFGSGIRDGKKSDPGSGINIPDPVEVHLIDNSVHGEVAGVENKMTAVVAIAAARYRSPVRFF
jgi:hypothetical protein